MTLYETVDFIGRVMRYFLDVSMAAFTFDSGVDTIIKDIFIHIKESEVTVFINPAYAWILMTQEAVSDVCSVRWHDCKTDE